MSNQRVLRAVAVTTALAVGFSARAAETFALATSPGGTPFWHLQRADTQTNILLGGFADGYPLAHLDKSATPLVGGALTRYGPKGTSSGDYNEQLKDVEARCGLSPQPMFTTFSVEAKPDDFGEALDLCFQMVTQPALRDSDLEKIRKSAIAGRERQEESREAVANILMRRLTQAKGPFARWGDPDVIAQVSAADVEQWRREVFARDNLTIVAVGAGDAASFGPLIDRTFGQLPAKAAPAPATPPELSFSGKTILLEREGAQTAMALEGPANLAPGEGPALLIGASVLGGGGLDSRLSKAVRGELGATYGISAGLGQVTPLQRTFAIRSALSNELALAGLKRIREVYGVWRRDGVTEDEAAPAREKLANGFDKSSESPSGKAYGLLSLLRGGATAEYEANYTKNLRAISTDTVNARVRGNTPAAMTTVIVAPKAEGFGADCVIHAIDEVDGCR